MIEFAGGACGHFANIKKVFCDEITFESHKYYLLKCNRSINERKYLPLTCMKS